jgi:hypothetical protein
VRRAACRARRGSRRLGLHAGRRVRAAGAPGGQAAGQLAAPELPAGARPWAGPALGGLGAAGERHPDGLAAAA